MPELALSPTSLPRWTIARRLLVGYGAVLVAFAITMGWSFRNMRAAAREAELLRAGYVPLQLSLDEALAEENVLATQLNHITTVKTPADVREWIDTATRARPGTIEAARKAAATFPGDDPQVAAFRTAVAREIDRIDEDLRAQPDAFPNLFRLLATDS